MARRLGLVLVLLAGCAEGSSERDLVSELSVEGVAAMTTSRVLAVSMAGIDAQTFVVARATTQGDDYCPKCLDPAAGSCAAICRRAVIDVTRYHTGAPADPVLRFHEAFPIQWSYDVDAIDVVALDETHAGVGWLECDHTLCGVSTPRRSCTARYAAVDLISGRAQPVATLYQDWYGDLQLAFNPVSRRLLAVLGKQQASGVGVRAAIYDEWGAKLLSPWQAYGGAAANTPVPVAEDEGFLIAADDPAPAMPAAPEPCAEACNCQQQSVAEQPDGGLYALHPGLGKPPERIASRRATGGDGRPPTVVAAAGRVHVIVASSQPGEVDAQVFEPADSVWKPRYSAPASASASTAAPRWMGALADATHLAWIGLDEDADPTAQQRLVAGVAVDQRSQRGEIAEVAPGDLLRVAPVNDGAAVKSTYLLRSARSTDGGASVPRFEVLAVRAQW